MHVSTSDLRNFFQKVDLVDDNGCWIWGSAASSTGWAAYRGTSASRFAYQWFVGQIPDGLEMDHLCRNRLCVNPAHLEAVTRHENIRRMVASHGWDTACKQGHPRTPENTWKNGGGRRACRLCVIASRRRN